MKVFISYSSKDKDIIESFVTLLTNALRLNPDDIFCSSLDGHRINSGADWKHSIKSNLEHADIAFLLLSTNYKKSEICLSEMGAIYFNDNVQQIPLILPPLNKQSPGILYETKQVEDITDSASLDRIKDLITNNTKTKIRSDYWERQKGNFIESIKRFSKLATDIENENIETEDNFTRGYFTEYVADSVMSHASFLR